MNEFFEMRKKFYEKRKIFLRSKIQRELEILENKVNFIESFLNDSINIRNKKKTVLIAECTIEFKYSGSKRIQINERYL
jgi:DNA topoisomerase-2